MFLRFLGLFKYFVDQKRQFLNSQDQALTPFNTFVIYWTLFNFVLKCLNSFFVLTVLTLFQYTQLSESQEFDRNFIMMLYGVTLRTMVTITDMFNCNTILYLFYYQGYRLQQRAESGQLKLESYRISSLQIRNELKHPISNQVNDSYLQNQEGGITQHIMESKSEQEDSPSNKAMGSTNTQFKQFLYEQIKEVDYDTF